MLTHKSASSPNLSFTLWIEPHLCLPFRPLPSKKSSLRVVPKLTYLVACPHSTESVCHVLATHQFRVFTLLFPLLVQSPQEWIGLDQGLGLNPLLALLLKEVVSAQETCTELRRNWGPDRARVRFVQSVDSPLLLTPSPREGLRSLHSWNCWKIPGQGPQDPPSPCTLRPGPGLWAEPQCHLVASWELSLWLCQWPKMLLSSLVTPSCFLQRILESNQI